ncbi:MAG TPA: hypothetical protein VGO92_08835 [Acidimicrobiales bacterium]|jgi:hypothetical protein|nr:hypothetical protein [Acidimicrobiales bacterium]
MDVPPPDPDKLLAAWLAWERGDESPGQTLANLKKAGMRELLESTAKAHQEMFGAQ